LLVRQTCEVLFCSAARSAARRRAEFSLARSGGRGRAPAGEGVEAHDHQPGEALNVSAWAKARRPAGPQPGVVAMSFSARVGVGSGLVAYRSFNSGRPGVLLGSSVVFGSGCGEALPGVPRKAPLCSYGTRRAECRMTAPAHGNSASDFPRGLIQTDHGAQLRGTFEAVTARRKTRPGPHLGTLKYHAKRESRVAYHFAGGYRDGDGGRRNMASK